MSRETESMMAEYEFYFRDDPELHALVHFPDPGEIISGPAQIKVIKVFRVTDPKKHHQKTNQKKPGRKPHGK